jgi:hypothetical protein
MIFHEFSRKLGAEVFKKKQLDLDHPFISIKYTICRTSRNMRRNAPQAVFRKDLIFNLNIFNF